MTWIEVLLTGIALSMDALAVSLAYGMSMGHFRWRDGCKIALYFGGFQTLMPILGWLAGTGVRQYIEALDHWLAFGLLALIGGRMVWNGFHPEPEQKSGLTVGIATKRLLFMAVATSVDALVVGIGMAMTQVNIWSAAAGIGCVTFIICLLGVALGRRAGKLLGQRAELLGGVVLIGIGLRILIEHLNA